MKMGKNWADKEFKKASKTNNKKIDWVMWFSIIGFAAFWGIFLYSMMVY